MVVEMENRAVSIIKSFKSIDETMYPESDLKESSRYLSGFKWHDEARPKDKDDIFRSVEAEMPKVEAKPKETAKEALTETETIENQEETKVEEPSKEEQPKRHRERKKVE